MKPFLYILSTKTMLQSFIAVFLFAVVVLNANAEVVPTAEPSPIPDGASLIYSSKDFKDWTPGKANGWKYDKGFSVMLLDTDKTTSTDFLTSPSTFDFSPNAAYHISLFFRAQNFEEEEISIYLSESSPVTSDTPNLIPFSDDFHLQRKLDQFGTDPYYLVTFNTPNDFTAGAYFITIKGHAGARAYARDGIWIADFAFYASSSQSTACEASEHGYILHGDDPEAWTDALNDASAMHYDATKVTLPSQLQVANPNALLQLAVDASVSSNANIVYANGEDGLSAESVSIDASLPFLLERDIATNAASLTRKAHADADSPRKFVTLVLPFETANASKAFTIRDISDDSEALLFASVKDSQIPAYTPLLYQIDGEDTTLLGQNIEKADDADSDGLVIASCPDSRWSCAFATHKIVIDDVTTDERFAGYSVYYISNDKFFRATGSLTLHPFRAIFLLPCEPALAPSRFGIAVIPNDATAISTLDDASDAASLSTPSYTPSGIPATSSHRGIIIRPQQKTLIP